MPLVVGHSQTKYLSDYLCKGSYTVFSCSGYKTLQFMNERDVFKVAPFFSVVVFVVGANDIGTKTPVRVFEDIVALCEGVHNATPSATILISELLPRARNRFNGNGYRQDFLEHWNYDAGVVNKLLREFASKVPWVRVIEHPEFHTMFGANVYLLSRDGLHLTIDGTNTVASNIETAVTSLTKPTRPTYPGPDTQSSRPAPTHTTPTYEYGPRRYSDVLSEPAAKKSKKMAKLCKMEDNFPVDANNPSLETHKNDKLFIERFSSLFNSEKLSDIVLIVGDQRFYAHKFMLIVSSDVFEVMFNEIRWKESSQVEVSLTEDLECVAVFPHFLRYIYTGGVSLTTDNVLPILFLADKYNIPALVQICVEYMLHHVVENPDTNRTLSWYQYAKITANTLLVDKCRKFILSNFDIILQTSDWMTLTKAEVWEFLSSNDLVVSDEYYLWMMVDKWFSCDCHQPSSKDVEDIISLIHFTMIPPKQLLEIEKSCLYLNHKEFFREKLNFANRHHSLLLNSVDLKGTEERFRNYTSECYRICCDLNMSHYLSTEKCQSKINQRIISSYDFFSAPSGLSKNNQAEFDITFWPKCGYGKLSDNASLSIRMIPKKQEHLLIGITFIVYGIKNGVRYVAYSYANKNTFSNTNTLFVEDNLMSLKRFHKENSPFLISGNLEAKLFLKVEEVIMPEQRTP